MGDESVMQDAGEKQMAGGRYEMSDKGRVNSDGMVALAYGAREGEIRTKRRFRAGDQELGMISPGLQDPLIQIKKDS